MCLIENSAYLFSITVHDCDIDEFKYAFILFCIFRLLSVFFFNFKKFVCFLLSSVFPTYLRNMFFPSFSPVKYCELLTENTVIKYRGAGGIFVPNQIR